MVTMASSAKAGGMLAGIWCVYPGIRQNNYVSALLFATLSFIHSRYRLTVFRHRYRNMTLRMKYTHQDFIWSTEKLEQTSVKERDKLSEFDRVVCEAWDNGIERGYFRYTLDGMKSRLVPGKHGYVLQLNLKRGIERRKPEFIESLSKPFDPTKFNFTKVKKEEIICELSSQEKHDTCECASEHPGLNCGQRHLLLINVSPLEYGHILLVPDIDKSLPQRLTLNAIKLGIDVILLSAHPGWRVGFNSLCALASVNHQHLHAWYLESSIRTEYAPVREVGAGLFELQDMPTRALAFQLQGQDTLKLARDVFTAADYLQKNNIAHNLFMTRGSTFNQSGKQTVRVYIWPRQSVVGQKNEHIDEVVFNVAVAELAGHIPMFAPDLYEDLTEEYINSRLGQQMLPLEEFDLIKDTIRKLL